jgi:hypothetical protein
VAVSALSERHEIERRSDFDDPQFVLGSQPRTGLKERSII